MTTGEALKRFRYEFGLSQKTVAQQVKVLPQVYSRYETDQRSPTVELLMTLADVYNVTTDYLLGRSDTPRPAPNNEQLLNALLGCRDLIQSALDSKVKSS